uniref:Uncharacterized protein n=1 Tax=viral metagenome TaxID=1070528 RepID=A0A6C0KD68_9ZZZZ
MDIGAVWEQLLSSSKWKSIAKRSLVGELPKNKVLRELKKSVK